MTNDKENEIDELKLLSQDIEKLLNELDSIDNSAKSTDKSIQHPASRQKSLEEFDQWHRQQRDRNESYRLYSSRHESVEKFDQLARDNHLSKSHYQSQLKRSTDSTSLPKNSQESKDGDRRHNLKANTTQIILYILSTLLLGVSAFLLLQKATKNNNWKNSIFNYEDYIGNSSTADTPPAARQPDVITPPSDIPVKKVNHTTCADTLNSLKNDIEKYTSGVEYVIKKSSINSPYVSRNVGYQVILGSLEDYRTGKIDNIKRFDKNAILEKHSNQIMANCKEVASIEYAAYATDGGKAWIYTDNGVKQAKCKSLPYHGSLPWGYTIC